jgi:hypothetical protein
MKEFTSLLTGIFFLVLSLNANAQAKTGADYFAGKWTVTFKGTADGDKKMVFVLEKKDAAINGVVQDTTGKELSKITKAELNANTITLYFTVNEHDVSTGLTKKDEDHATGNAMGMFDAEAERVKAMKLSRFELLQIERRVPHS